MTKRLIAIPQVQEDNSWKDFTKEVFPMGTYYRGLGTGFSSRPFDSINRPLFEIFEDLSIYPREIAYHDIEEDTTVTAYKVSYWEFLWYYHEALKEKLFTKEEKRRVEKDIIVLDSIAERDDIRLIFWFEH